MTDTAVTDQKKTEATSITVRIERAKLSERAQVANELVELARFYRENPSVTEQLTDKALGEASLTITKQGSDINVLQMAVKQWKAKHDKERSRNLELAARVVELESKLSELIRTLDDRR